ncbi:BadF/BadG/BcrA/BcrD ATPase family protein [Bacillus carboniphilus]|uniref:BadF/BadG/BcrA/BcrD ATPase family protein n=1 Tax=Bacillus carboniphilus TaxID=86663 RepID=A0ABP3FSC1_9BACI
MKYVIGIDGGGTKTKATSFSSPEGEPLFSVQKGRANFTVQYEDSLKQVVECVEACIESAGGVLPEKILVGAAGAHSPEICMAVEADLRKVWACEIVVTSDAQLAHTALLEGSDGLLVISGTGSIVLGRHNGIEWKTGGWGYLLGDEGSGYWIGIQALQHVMRVLERNGGANVNGKAGFDDRLTSVVLKHIGGDSMSDVKNYVYTGTKEDISSLSRLVGDTAEAGCEMSSLILRGAGVELARLVVDRAVLGHEEMLASMKVAVSGSILMKNEIVFEAFRNIVSQNFPDCEIVRSAGDVCRGVLYI